MDQTREKLQCAVCGWPWWKRLGAPDPKRCASPQCRSMRWKDGRRGRGHVVDQTGEGEDPHAVPEGCATVETAVEERRYVPIEED